MSEHAILGPRDLDPHPVFRLGPAQQAYANAGAKAVLAPIESDPLRLNRVRVFDRVQRQTQRQLLVKRDRIALVGGHRFNADPESDDLGRVSSTAEAELDLLPFCESDSPDHPGGDVRGRGLIQDLACSIEHVEREQPFRLRQGRETNV